MNEAEVISRDRRVTKQAPLSLPVCNESVVYMQVQGSDVAACGSEVLLSR
jgi:hypothetical protein